MKKTSDCDRAQYIMNNPVITSDQRTYDLRTLEHLHGESPFTREPFRRLFYNTAEYLPNFLLRSKMEALIEKKERELGDSTGAEEKKSPGA